MARRRPVNNPLALALLASLDTGGPTHPYELASTLRSVKWGSFYTVVQNLEKYGLIEAVGTDRDGRRPERTTYAVTDDGRAELKDWLRELVAVPETEPPAFEAALSVLGVLPPDEVTALLATRVAALEDDLAARRTTGGGPLAAQYALAMRQAELAWCRRVLDTWTA